MAIIRTQPENILINQDPGLGLVRQIEDRKVIEELNYNKAKPLPLPNNYTVNQVTTIVNNIIQNNPPTGVDGQIQVNENGQLVGDTGLTYVPTTDTLTTGTIVVGNIIISGVANLGNVNTIVIQGGYPGEVLTSNGTGLVHWATPYPSVANKSGKFLVTDGINVNWSNIAYSSFATTTDVSNAIGNLINSAPTALDTLGELANALGNSGNLTISVVNQLANKVNSNALALVATSGNFSDLNYKPNLSDYLPSQASNSGKYLTTNGTSASWGIVTIPTDIANLSDTTNLLGGGGGVSTALDNSSAGDMDVMTYDGNIKYTSRVTIDVSTGALKANTVGISNSGTLSKVNVGFSYTSPTNGPGGFTVQTNSLTVGIPNPSWASAILAHPDRYHIDFNGGPTGIPINDIIGPQGGTNIYTLTGTWPSNSTGFPITIASNDYKADVTKIASPNGLLLSTDSEYIWKFDDNGIMYLPGDNQPSKISFSEAQGAYINQGMGEIDIRTGPGAGLQIQTDAGFKYWTFNANGNLALPVGGDILDSTGNSVLGGAGGGLAIGDFGEGFSLDNSDKIVNNKLVNGSKTVSLGADGSITFPDNRILQVTDSSLGVQTSKTVITDNIWTVGSDILTNIDEGNGVVPGWGQRNPQEIQIDLFTAAYPLVSTLPNLALGSTVIVTYSTAGSNATYTGLLSQQFTIVSNYGSQVRLSGRINGTLPVGQTGIVSINFPEYSTQNSVWTFGADGDLSLPGGITFPYNYHVGPGEGSLEISSPGAVAIIANAGMSSNLWLFDTDGVLTLPNGAVIKDNAGDSVAFGQDAGSTSQGVNAVAIGKKAGHSDQGIETVAIGALAGIDTQGQGAVAVGVGAGYNLQGVNSVAIGKQAGLGDQGNAAVAIGYRAGYTGQAANTIILNASGVEVNGVAAQTNSFYVAPIRTDATPGNVLYYNTATKEVTYGTAPSDSVSSLVNGSKTVSLDSGGNLTFADAGETFFGNGYLQSGTSGTNIGIKSWDGRQKVFVNETNVTIQTVNNSSQAYDWTFETDGNLTLPSNTSKINYANGTSILSGLGAGGSAPVHTGYNAGSNIVVVAGAVKVRYNGMGDIELQSASGTIGVTWSGQYTTGNTITVLAGNRNLTTSAWIGINGNVGSSGDTIIIILMDNTNGRIYRITAIVTPTGNCGSVIIETLI